MASIKVKYRPSTAANHEGSIYYQIIHGRKVRQLLSDYRIHPEEWDEKRSTVRTTNDSNRKNLVMSIKERIRWDLERLNKIDKQFDARGVEYTTDDIIDEFTRYATEYTLFNFMESQISKLKQQGRIRTSETYTAALYSFKRHREGKDIMLDRLTSDIMESYEAWLKGRGLSPNTISFYTRILRAVYNRAVEQEIIENRSPFKHVYTGIEKTVKRALPLPILKKIKNIDLSSTPALDYARDMFMLSFYLRGMSFVDMAFLRKSDLNNGCVIYRRRKTGQQLTIGWTKEMQAIIDKYPKNPTDYLLPIITDAYHEERNAYHNMGFNINHNLKKIALKIGLQVPLTLYVARHSWASVAKNKGIPLGVISEGMGHDSEQTTRIYLASLDTSVVDHANSIIIKSLS